MILKIIMAYLIQSDVPGGEPARGRKDNVARVRRAGDQVTELCVLNVNICRDMTRRVVHSQAGARSEWSEPR